MGGGGDSVVPPGICSYLLFSNQNLLSFHV